MTKKRNVELLHKDVRIVRFETGEFKPLFVKSANIGNVVIGLSSKTMCNLRSQKRGPKYYMVGGTPYYKLEDLENYFGANPVDTTDGKLTNKI
jgi:hypothetical protein